MHLPKPTLRIHGTGKPRRSFVAICRRARRFPLATLGLLCGSPTAISAQRPAPFETVEIRLGVRGNVNETVFHEYWDVGVGLSAQVRTPFYLGAIALGVHVAGSAATRPNIPDFVWQYFYVAWGPSFDLPGPFELEATVGTGLTRMLFDITDPGLRAEAEVAHEAAASLHVRPIAGWSIVASGRYRRVFTHERINLAFVGIGVGHTFVIPQWARDLLR